MFASYIYIMRSSSGIISLAIVVLISAQSCNSHGRLIEPPSRASAWRYGFNTPPDYNDHELYCGGFTRQWKVNEGKCGECGDAWDLPQPRPHEYGGQWGQGIIVRRYKPESIMKVRVELTASHMGYFEFRICPETIAKQSCFDKYLLKLLGGSPSQPTPHDLETRFYPRNGSRIYEIEVQLPNINCTQCVLQWRYIAGNNWGICPEGTHGAVGCGPQEEFRSCSDIAIGESLSDPMRPKRPTARPTLLPKPDIISTEPNLQNDSTSKFNYTILMLVLLVMLLAMCCWALWYINRVNHSLPAHLKVLFRNHLCNKNASIASETQSHIFAPNLLHQALGNPLKRGQSQFSSNNASESAPVPPPRMKKLTRSKDIPPEEFIIA